MKKRTLLIALGVLLVAAVGVCWWLLMAPYLVREAGLLLQAMHHTGTYRIRFGIIGKDPDGDEIISKETTTIPLRYHDSGFLYGFEIVPSDNRPYSFHCVIHFAATPKVITGEAFESNKPAATMQTQETSAQGAVVQDYWFDPGDSLGAESMEVYINGKLIETVRYTVVPAN